LSQVFVYRVVVGPSDIDFLDHASNIAYVRWVQDATVAHSEAVGLNVDTYKSLGGIFVIRRHEVDYLRSAVLGDELEIHTQVAAVTAAKAYRATQIYRTSDNALLARASTVWGYVQTDTGRPARVPQWVRDAFGLQTVAPAVAVAAAQAACG